MDLLLNSAMVNWSRAQFAMTAGYHWLFVPLTLGLAIIMSIMESIYVKTGDESWKRATKFWQKIFGINFAIGVATGIILEFQFGTNWSNYSWFVGDIFGAPLVIEGIVAFFLEATFISIMFFGWNRVSKKAHLTATWLTTIGATLSAYWILVANAWMQYPIGMEFNPDTVRNEMTDFWALVSSSVAINKFFHAVLSGWGVAASFVVGISAWYLIKKRHIDFALKSIKMGAVFGFISFVLLAVTGDGSAYQVSQKQPMKLAAMEGLYKGQAGAGLIAVGVLNPKKESFDDDVNPYIFKITIPKLLSYLGYRDLNAFVPGIKDIIYGGYKLQDGTTALSFAEKKERGQKAVEALVNYKAAKEDGRISDVEVFEKELRDNYAYFGYSYLENPEDNIPNVHITFYSFHVMVIIGMYFILLFLVIWIYGRKKKLHSSRWLLYVGLWSIPFAYLAGQLGWIVAEVGRQPWTIQDVLPVKAAVSNLGTGHVLTTFILFAVMFTALLVAEVTIMVKQIKKGPEEIHNDDITKTVESKSKEK
ncbi:MAG: cytochrome ubiquinol oxidase subunit I [Dysgonamonadaceae bacterium]|jgi:cytochrome d ubiquinol oxidase subunit I|nr:cytochrome ubiquinol oxidase subunit I [Dysgonamonadaceae bacterium]MDD3309488.1 cytochrome ubiquinol oxidase subunit I [Dysgonamonadaceae bacterium]MDD3900989.1 cytochrome ubiquinol oxidase subunit I [Dysgonamonadaceae bacterium]MDD4399541.1 cytochrome ubiquinol oxidase subunit I [Dysgonamonadaceae bacterium]MEA5081787.1 cytochrome ubiquinol oxidase subunit I [Dysgonamonadaceae bacterium]